MRNLYTVTLSRHTGETDCLHVVAPTGGAAIRKAIKTLFGSAAAAPAKLEATAELTAAEIII
ncbi:MAG: hypothetical protein LUE89_11285 [Clostridiales bacterium]|nr:hypothetical protein [Clostridiales bacterium]